MVLHFLNTVPRHPETVVLQQIGHNLSLDGLVVFLGIDTQNDLMLQLHQLLTDGRIFQHLIQHLLLITIEINEDIILQSQGPTDQGSLTDSGISGMTIYGQQHLELRQIEMIQGRQHNSTDQHLLVVDVNSGRKENLFHGRGLTFTPDSREPETVKPVGYQLLMLLVQRLFLLCLSMLGLQSQHRTLSHKSLQGFLQCLRGPVT